MLVLLSLTAVIWLTSAYTSYRDTRHEIGELFDAQMAQTARTLLSVAGHELIELAGAPLDSTHIHFTGETSFTAGGHRYEHKLAYQLWQQPENILLLRSFSAPQMALSDKASGYSTREIEGQRWRIFSLVDNNSGFQIQVGESMAIRDELTAAIALRAGMPLLLALPLLALLISLGINRSLRPLQRLAQTIARRAPDNLEAVDDRRAPSEIRPLLAALNTLFRRLAEAFENERRFTADAAHELRTPLAALRVQAQVAQRSTDEEERQQALEKLQVGVERASRLVDQLLTLARVDPESGLAQREPIALDGLAEEVLSVFTGEAAIKQLELDLAIGRGCIVAGQRDSLAILLRNLIDNAIRYTPEKGRIELSIKREEDGVVLRIGDSGPGIPEAQRERIFDRFYRVAGQEIAGCGLGLSIVKRIAELHGAELSLGDSPIGGLEVRLWFPEQNER
jgi:two-component system sensor histidine kinase QseC